MLIFLKQCKIISSQFKKVRTMINKQSPKTRGDFLKDVVKQLVHRRRELELTQEQVDHIMGNADRLCSKWECGMRTPTAFNLYCWAEALSVSIQIVTLTKHE